MKTSLDFAQISIFDITFIYLKELLMAC